eukprot:TRINITY_DN55601_c0_g1_i1.p1 TRINITY_DN55601_c0_g1~~TRINITY_DN55601_c0_g1_i1.p1  ORF type:complete len:133 (-),score=19.37 TRINITY_DN55601_c0_g1_i1:86-484(-)
MRRDVAIASVGAAIGVGLTLLRTRRSSLRSVAPVVPVGATATVEYCVGCKWLLRAAWVAQELLSTFQEGGLLGAVTLVPNVEKPGGRFTVRVGNVLVWDRKADGGFPEIKVLKQRVRDVIDPTRDLGHNDRH